SSASRTTRLAFTSVQLMVRSRGSLESMMYMRPLRTPTWSPMSQRRRFRRLSTRLFSCSSAMAISATD
ncbi:hypothetical protein IWW55_004285, partial [Coemansia sp. RSA 2706]